MAPLSNSLKTRFTTRQTVFAVTRQARAVGAKNKNAAKAGGAYRAYARSPPTHSCSACKHVSPDKKPQKGTIPPTETVFRVTRGRIAHQTQHVSMRAAILRFEILAKKEKKKKWPCIG